MFFANIAILILGFVETKTVLHLLRIPFQFLAPGILLLATVGAYAVRNLAMDVAVMFAAGIMAFFLRRTGYSIPGIVLGLILGKLGEQNFAQAMQLVSYDFVAFSTRPIVAILLLAGIATILTNVYRALSQAPVKRDAGLAIAPEATAAGHPNGRGTPTYEHFTQHRSNPQPIGDATPREVVLAALMERARAAMDGFATQGQARIDEAVTALAWSLYKPENARALAEMAVADTGLGNAADKIVKNQRKTFGTLRDLLRVKTTGVIEDDPGARPGDLWQAGRRGGRGLPLDQPLGDAHQQGDDGAQGRQRGDHRPPRPPAGPPPRGRSSWPAPSWRRSASMAT